MPPRTRPAVGLLGTDGTTCSVISWDHFKETLPKRMPQGVTAWDRLWGVGGQVPRAIEEAQESEEGAGLHLGAAAEKPESGASPRSPRALSAKCSLSLPLPLPLQPQKDHGPWDREGSGVWAETRAKKATGPQPAPTASCRLGQVRAGGADTDVGRRSGF